LRLIIFTRYPEAGKVKTRLIPALGKTGAAALHRKMAEQTIAQARLYAGEIEVRFTGGNQQLMHEWLGPGLLYREQQGASLGEKISSALTEAFTQGKNKVVIIGSDCPRLTVKHINTAFQALAGESELVIGPATDGGYYLLGLCKYNQELFSEISWGSNHVYRQTMDAATKLSIKTTSLEYLADVDQPDDLTLWANRLL
jgi:uncharacterized protein